MFFAMFYIFFAMLVFILTNRLCRISETRQSLSGRRELPCVYPDTPGRFKLY